MKITEVRDYAMPTMVAEKALKEAHLAMLEGDSLLACRMYMECIDKCKEAIEVVMEVYLERKA